MEGGTKCGAYGEWMKNHPWCKKISALVILLVVVFVFVKMITPESKDASQQDTITVSGKGELNVKPDIAEISFSVMNENKDVSQASNAVNTSMATIVAKLKADGVDESDIKTTGYDIYPRYNYVNQTMPMYNNIQTGTVVYPNGGGTQVLAGYDVTQSIDVKIRDLSKAGQIVTDLGTLGVTNMSGLSFTEDKYDDLVKQARTEAIADARSQADDLAQALGVHLGKVTSYSDGGNYPRPVYATMSASASNGSAQSAVLPTGQNTIDSNVTVTYEIW